MVTDEGINQEAIKHAKCAIESFSLGIYEDAKADFREGARWMRDQMQQALIDAAGDAFDAAREGTGGYYIDTGYVPPEHKYPDKETYLKTLTQK